MADIIAPVAPQAGWKSSEFWIHILASVGPAVLTAILSTLAPGNPLALAVVAALAAIAGHAGAAKYTAARTDLKLVALALQK